MTAIDILRDIQAELLTRRLEGQATPTLRSHDLVPGSRPHDTVQVKGQVVPPVPPHYPGQRVDDRGGDQDIRLVACDRTPHRGDHAYSARSIFDQLSPGLRRDLGELREYLWVDESGGLPWHSHTSPLHLPKRG